MTSIQRLTRTRTQRAGQTEVHHGPNGLCATQAAMKRISGKAIRQTHVTDQSVSFNKAKCHRNFSFINILSFNISWINIWKLAQEGVEMRRRQFPVSALMVLPRSFGSFCGEYVYLDQDGVPRGVRLHKTWDGYYASREGQV